MNSRKSVGHFTEQVQSLHLMIPPQKAYDSQHAGRNRDSSFVIHPCQRSAWHNALLQRLAAGSSDAHADEQPR